MSFDFTALLGFLIALFEALQKLATKLGLDLGFGDDSTTAPETTA